MSVAIGASAAGARAYTATASQGLLYMAEAVYNAAGLGLPIVMTVGEPGHRRADQHLERPQRRHGPAGRGWIQLYAETNQEAAGPAHPGLPARRAAVGPGHGVHGRLHPHPRLRAGRHPDPGQVDAFLPPYEPRQVLDPAEPGVDRRHGGTRGVHRGALPRHDRSCRRSTRIPELARGVRREFGRDPAGWSAPYRIEDAETSWSRSARCSAPSRSGRRTARRRASGSGCSASARSGPFPAEAVRDALAGARGVVVLERALAAGHRRHRVRRRARWRSARTPVRIHTVVAGLGGRADHQQSLRRLLASAAAGDARAAHLPRPRPGWSSGNWRGCASAPVRAQRGKHAA